MKPYYDEDGITIYHADCREVLPLVPAESVDLVLTDPPYGIEWDGDYRRFAPINKDWGVLAVHGDQEPFDPSPLFRFETVILWGANFYRERLPEGGSWIIWDKVTRNGVSTVLSDGEMAWTNAPGKRVSVFRHMWTGAFRDSERGAQWHPTQKPVSLMRWILERWSEPGDLILDPYMGSGPVARAALDLGRRYIGIEIEERYCEIAVQRLAQGVLEFG